MSKDLVFWFIAASIYGAILYMLVRPNSNGPVLVTTVLNNLSDLVRGSIGYTWQNGKWTAP